MGCKNDRLPSEQRVDPEPKLKWGGDLCTTPSKEFREPETPRGDGSEISGTEDHSNLKATEAECPRTTGSEEPPADYGEKLLARESRLRSYNYPTEEEAPEDRKEGIAVHRIRLARDAPGGQVYRSRRSVPGGKKDAHTTGWWNKRAKCRPAETIVRNAMHEKGLAAVIRMPRYCRLAGG